MTLGFEDCVSQKTTGWDRPSGPRWGFHTRSSLRSGAAILSPRFPGEDTGTRRARLRADGTPTAPSPSAQPACGTVPGTRLPDGASGSSRVTSRCLLPSSRSLRRASVPSPDALLPLPLDPRRKKASPRSPPGSDGCERKWHGVTSGGSFTSRCAICLAPCVTSGRSFPSR